MIQVIAWGLEVGHPAVYLLIFMLVGIPLLVIILFGGQQKWKDKRQ